MNKNIIHSNKNASDIPQEFAEISTLCVATEVMIGGRSVLGIADARTLHEGLGVGRDFSTWIQKRITTYSFEEGIDYYVLLPQMGEQKPRQDIEDKTTTCSVNIENKTQPFDSPNRGNQKSGRGGDKKQRFIV